MEWVVYHLLSGFTDIVIYSNDSTDGTTELLDALDESGVISHALQDLVSGQVPQHEAADSGFYHPSFEHADWLMWLDSDEFLYCSNDENNLIELIRKVEPQAAGVAINWLNFGDGGHKEWAEEFVTQKFLCRGNPQSSKTFRFYKTLFKKSDKIRGFGLHRPFFKWAYEEKDGKFVNASGEGMHELYYRAGGRRRHRLGDAPPELVAHEWASIFHYAVKTEDSFELKKQRGQGTKFIGAENRSSRFRNKYWEIFNRNEVYDPRMLKFADRLQEKVDELLAVEAIARAHQNCIERYKAALQQVKVERAETDTRSGDQHTA